jgi:hypothetical protein
MRGMRERDGPGDGSCYVAFTIAGVHRSIRCTPECKERVQRVVSEVADAHAAVAAAAAAADAASLEADYERDAIPSSDIERWKQVAALLGYRARGSSPGPELESTWFRSSSVAVAAKVACTADTAPKVREALDAVKARYNARAAAETAALHEALLARYEANTLPLDKPSQWLDVAYLLGTRAADAQAAAAPQAAAGRGGRVDMMLGSELRGIARVAVVCDAAYVPAVRAAMAAVTDRYHAMERGAEEQRVRRLVDQFAAGTVRRRRHPGVGRRGAPSGS